LYAEVVEKVVVVSSSRVAEAAKLLENIYRAVNIALVNELKMTFDGMGVDVWEPSRPRRQNPSGSRPSTPAWSGRSLHPPRSVLLDLESRRARTVDAVHRAGGRDKHSMPAWVVEKAAQALSDDGKSVRNAKVLVLGLSYKPDIDDDRESPSYELIRLLRERGADVSYCDPHFPSTPRRAAMTWGWNRRRSLRRNSPAMTSYCLPRPTVSSVIQDCTEA